MLIFSTFTRKKFLSSLQFHCKRVLVYLLIFTQLYSPAAYGGGKIFFEISEVDKKGIARNNPSIEEPDSRQVVSRIHLKISERNEDDGPDTITYEHDVEFDIFNPFNPCKIPGPKPTFTNPGIGCPFHEYFEHSGQNLKINHYDVSKDHGVSRAEEISFTVSRQGDIEIQRFSCPHRKVSIKTFGNISTNIPQYNLKFLSSPPSFGTLNPGELGAYLREDILYCKTHEKKEISVMAADVIADERCAANTYDKAPTDEDKGTLFLAPHVLTNLKKARRDGALPSSKDQNTLLKFTALSGYIPTILGGKSLHLTGKTIGCFNPFLMQEDLCLEASHNLFNKTHLQGKRLNLSADTIKNSHKMVASNRLFVDVKTLFENGKEALAFAADECTFQGTGSLQNYQEGEIKCTGNLVSYLPDVDNHGSIIADLSIDFKQPLNDLRNCGMMISHGTLGIHALSTVKNYGFLEGRCGKVAVTAHELFNKRSLGSFNGPLEIKVEKGKNLGSIFSKNQGGIHLTFGELFKNSREITSDDSIHIKGTGALHNEKMGTIKAPQAFFDIKDFQNFGKILVERILKILVGKGFNEGTIQGDLFTFTVLDEFVNKPSLDQDKSILHGGESFTLEGDGHFINQHILRAEDRLALKNKTFRNEGHVEAGGTLEIGSQGGVGLINAEGAKVLSKGLMKTAGATSLTNHKEGLFLSQGDMLLSHLSSFTNEGIFCSQGLLKLISERDLINHHMLLGNLGIQLGAAGLCSNRGNIESDETIGIQATRLVNYHKIQAPQGVTLNASHCLKNKENAEVNCAEGKVTLISPHFSLQGPVKGENVDVHHQGTTPFREKNIEAIDTLTLHVPYGWSLEDKSQKFGHSIILHGPLRDPGKLNIKDDFIWHNPEELSNDFNIIVGGKLIFNFAKPWVNLGLVEGQRGSTVTTPHFSNKGVFNSCKKTTFTCANGFENHNLFVMHGRGAIHTPAGSLTNHLGANFQQFGRYDEIVFNAAQAVRNIGGHVYIEGTLKSRSILFANERGNDDKVISVNVTPPAKNGTQEVPGRRASFHAGRALITARTLFNKGSALSAGELFQFKGAQLDNLTRDYYMRWTVPGKKKKKKKRFGPIKWGGRKGSKDANHSQLIHQRIATLCSQGSMKLTIGGRIYSGRAIAALNGGNSSSPYITNTGGIYADEVHFDVRGRAPLHLDFSPVNSKKTKIPPYISLASYFEDLLKGPQFWTLDETGSTPYKLTSKLYTPRPSAETIETQRQAAHEEREAQEADLPAFKEWMRRLLREQFDKDWAQIRQKNPRQTYDEALTRYLEENSDLMVSWEPKTKDLAPTSPESFSHLPPRLAVVNHPDYQGGERLLTDLTLLANQVIKVTMSQFGRPTLSRSIYNPLLYTRLLEDEGYLNARRAHGLDPLPAPEDWIKLSPKEQLKSQLREIITLPEIEQFKDPTIVYELINFHGNNVLSAIMTFPKSIRKAFKFLMGKRFFSNYFSIKTKGDVSLEGLEARKGLDGESEKGSVSLIDLLSQGKINFKADEALHLSERIEGESIHADAKTSLKVIGAALKAKKDITLKSGGTVDIEAKEIQSHIISGGKKNRHETWTVHNKPTAMTAGCDITIDAKGRMRVKGLRADADGKIHLKSETDSPELQNVYDFIQENHTKIKKRFLGSGSKKILQNTTSTMIRNRFRAKTTIIEGKTDLILEPADFKNEETVLISHQGNVEMRVGKYLTASSVQKKKNYCVWQKQQNTGRIAEQGEITHVEGKWTVKAKKVVAETPQNISLDALVKDPRHAWLKPLLSNPETTLHRIELARKKWHHKAQGLTPGGAALLSLAVGIVTAGTGALATIGGAVGSATTTALGSAVAGNIAGAMASAGFTTLTTQASISLVNNRGHIGKTLKDLGSKQNIRSLAISMATAGLTEGVLQGLDGLQTDPTQAAGLSQKGAQGGVSSPPGAAASKTGALRPQPGAVLSPPGATISPMGAAASETAVQQGLSGAQAAVSPSASLLQSIKETAAKAFSLPDLRENLRRTAVQAGVSAGFATLVEDQRPGEAFLQGVRAFAATAADTFAAKVIGDAHHAGKIGPVTQIVSHGLAGAGFGALFSSDPASGAAAGALGATTAELVADSLPATLAPRMRADLGRIAAGLTALALDQDVNTAIFTGTIATTWNHEQHAYLDQDNEENGGQEDAGYESPDTDDEADKTFYGKGRKKVISTAQGFATDMGLLLSPQEEQRLRTIYEQGAPSYIEEQLALAEKKKGEPLTNWEKISCQQISEMKFQTVADYIDPPFQQRVVNAGVGVVAKVLDLPFQAIEYGLRAGGMPKGDARALHHAVDDAFLVTGATGFAKGMAKKTVKATAKTTTEVSKKTVQSSAALGHAPTPANKNTVNVLQGGEKVAKPVKQVLPLPQGQTAPQTQPFLGKGKYPMGEAPPPEYGAPRPVESSGAAKGRTQQASPANRPQLNHSPVKASQANRPQAIPAQAQPAARPPVAGTSELAPRRPITRSSNVSYTDKPAPKPKEQAVRPQREGQPTAAVPQVQGRQQLKPSASEQLGQPLSYWNRADIHTFKGQTNKVYKRDDLIDLNRAGKDSRTNLMRMKDGDAPIGPDNKPINLHHTLQTHDSALAEVTASFHQQHSSVIHINPSSTPSGIDRNAFGQWRTEYWKARAYELENRK
jgi:hypothetical protein